MNSDSVRTIKFGKCELWMEKIDRFFMSSSLAKAQLLSLIILKGFFAWTNLKCQVMQFAHFHATLISIVNKLNQVCAPVDFIFKAFVH